MTLRRAIADHLEEKGDVVATEAIRWTIDKGRSIEHSWYLGGTEDEGVVIPPKMHDKCLTLEIARSRLPASCLYSLNRLVAYYKALTADERLDVWNWTPKGAEV